MERKLFAFVLCLPALGLVGGCGGGQGTSTTPNGSLKTATVGQAKVSYYGKVSPSLSVNSNNVTVAGLAGAAFSQIDFYPTKSLSNTSLDFTRGEELWTYSNGVQTEITNNLRLGLAGKWSHDGRIAYVAVTSAGTAEVFTCFADGSHATQITSGSTYSVPAWSPDNLHLVVGQFTSGSLANLVTMNPDGTHPTTLLTGLTLFTPPVWSPDGASIYYCAANSSSIYQIYRVPAAGGTPVNVTPAGYSGDNCTNPEISPDGTMLAFIVSSNQAKIVDLSTGSQASLTPTGFSDSSIAFSPDGTTLAIERVPTSSGTGGIYECNFTGENAHLVVPDPVDQAGSAATAFYIDWSPFEGYRRFIGSSGALGSTSSGFLYSQVGDGFTGFVSFTATTPSSAVITPASPAGAGSPLVFSVAADAITRVVYSNGYYLPGTSISPTTTTNLIVSFSSATGQVTTVAPLAVRATPQAKIVGKNLAYDGAFSAIYDAHGKNLAPSGAKHLEIDPKTGALSSWN